MWYVSVLARSGVALVILATHITASSRVSQEDECRVAKFHRDLS